MDEDRMSDKVETPGAVTSSYPPAIHPSRHWRHHPLRQATGLVSTVQVSERRERRAWKDPVYLSDPGCWSLLPALSLLESLCRTIPCLYGNRWSAIFCLYRKHWINRNIIWQQRTFSFGLTRECIAS